MQKKASFPNLQTFFFRSVFYFINIQCRRVKAGYKCSEITMNHLYTILNYWFLLIIIIDNFYVHTVHLYNNQVFSPTDAKLDNLKNNFNFALKLTLKSSYMFRCENTIVREHTVRSLLKLQLLK